MNREDVLERIRPLTEVKTREVEHSPTTRVVVAPDMVVLRPGSGARTVEVAPDGIKSLATFASVPQGLTKELSPDTAGRVLTEMLSKKERYSLLLRDERVVSFADFRHCVPLNADRVLKTIERSIGATDFHRVLTSDNTVQLEVVGSRQLVVTKGDAVQAGATTIFSPLGVTSPMVQSYILRLACTNGMVAPEVLREFHFGGGGGGEGDDVWQWFRDSVRDAYRSADRVVKNCQKMRDHKIRAADRPLVLEALLRQAHISREVAEVVRTRAIEEPPATEYDAMNLITWASSHLIQDPRQVRRAQLAASDFASTTEHRRICPICHSQR